MVYILSSQKDMISAFHFLADLESSVYVFSHSTISNQNYGTVLQLHFPKRVSPPFPNGISPFQKGMREWLVQQQTCPTCRADITANEAKAKVFKAAAERADEERKEQEMKQASDATKDDSGEQDEKNCSTHDTSDEKNISISHYDRCSM